MGGNLEEDEATGSRNTWGQGEKQVTVCRIIYYLLLEYLLADFAVLFDTVVFLDVRR